MLSGINAMAQEEVEIIKSETGPRPFGHELKLNVGTAVCTYPEIEYEFITPSEFSAGLAAFFSLWNSEDRDMEFQLTPFGRVYFGKKQGAGAFLELNAALLIQNDNKSYWDERTGQSFQVRRKYLAGGMGLAAGYKWVTKNNFVIQLFGGAGRVYGKYKAIGVYPRAGVTLGKRF